MIVLRNIRAARAIGEKPMTMDEHRLVSATRLSHDRSRNTGENEPSSTVGQEPGLDDLFEDPIMALLWQSDGLEPPRARALIRVLLARAEGGRRGQSGLIRVRLARQPLAASLAA
jgi:hypothetical protein